MRIGDGDAWTCPDCANTVRGTPGARRRAQERHATAHRNDRKVTADRKAQADADRATAARATAKAGRRRKAHGGKAQHREQARHAR